MSLVIPSYKEVSIQCDEEKGTLWVGMNPMRRQYFTLSMLIELHDLIHKLDEYGSPDPARPDIIKYFVLQSDHPDIYNAGVDLEYFPELVRKKETERLRNYGVFCIDLIYWMLTGGKRMRPNAIWVQAKGNCRQVAIQNTEDGRNELEVKDWTKTKANRTENENIQNRSLVCSESRTSVSKQPCSQA